MRRKAAVLIVLAVMLTGLVGAGWGMTWEEYANEIYENAKGVTQSLKEEYDKGRELSDSEVETLYRMYRLQKSAKEIEYFAKANFTTITLSSGSDGLAEMDETIAGLWKDYISGKYDKKRFLELFFILYIE